MEKEPANTQRHQQREFSPCIAAHFDVTQNSTFEIY